MIAAKSKVWVVLVNWNGWRDSIECLESVLRSTYSDLGVIVCDNDSSDGSLEAIAVWAAGTQAYDQPVGPLGCLSSPPLPKPVRCVVLDDPAVFKPGMLDAPLLLVRTGRNLGFAGGNNVGIRIALSDPACRFVWLLNNDTVVDPICLERMVDVADADPAIGITGSLISFYARPDVVQALGGGRFFSRRVTGYLHGHCLPSVAITPEIQSYAKANLEWVSGVSMLVSRRFIECVGEMEECYFLYFEEIDWALRAGQKFKNGLADDALVYHKAGSSTGEQADNTFATYFQCRARFKLYRKMLHGLLPLCYLRTVKDCLGAVIRQKPGQALAILRAIRDEWLRR